MNLMGFQGGQYRPLSPEQIKTVHEASLKILEKTGMTYEQGLKDTVQMLEDNGAEVVVLPMPVTPAARVVMSVLPLSGCVLRSRAEVDWLDDEISNPGWTPESIAWCVGPESANRARERGWVRIVELAEGMDCDELVARIAEG